MIDLLMLQQMSNIDITQMDRRTLVDIRHVQIDISLPATQKMQSFLKQINNPYCFLCDDIPVKVRFISKNKTLKQLLCDYFFSIK